MKKPENAEIKKILTATKERIVKPHNWAKGLFACNAQGVPVDPLASEATRWSLSGALAVAGGRGESGSSVKINLAAGFVIWSLPEWARNLGLILFNDDGRTKHAHVIAVLDKAIARANDQPQKEDKHVK